MHRQPAGRLRQLGLNRLPVQGLRQVPLPFRRRPALHRRGEVRCAFVPLEPAGGRHGPTVRHARMDLRGRHARCRACPIADCVRCQFNSRSADGIVRLQFRGNASVGQPCSDAPTAWPDSAAATLASRQSRHAVLRSSPRTVSCADPRSAEPASAVTRETLSARPPLARSASTAPARSSKRPRPWPALHARGRRNCASPLTCAHYSRVQTDRRCCAVASTPASTDEPAFCMQLPDGVTMRRNLAVPRALRLPHGPVRLGRRRLSRPWKPMHREQAMLLRPQLRCHGAPCRCSSLLPDHRALQHHHPWPDCPDPSSAPSEKKNKKEKIKVKVMTRE
jgi:hypothetical protein